MKMMHSSPIENGLEKSCCFGSQNIKEIWNYGYNTRYASKLCKNTHTRTTLFVTLLISYFTIFLLIFHGQIPRVYELWFTCEIYTFTYK